MPRPADPPGSDQHDTVVLVRPTGTGGAAAATDGRHPRPAESGRAESGRAESGRAESGRAESRRAEAAAGAGRRRSRAARRPAPAASPESLAPPAPASTTLRLPPLVAGAAAALWSAVLGLSLLGLVVVLAWVAAPHDETPWSATLRAAGSAWLAAHHVPLILDGIPLTLTPWGLLLVPVLLLALTTRWAVRTGRVRDGGAVALLVAGAAGAYGIAGAGVSLLVGGAELTVLTTEAAVLTAAVAALVVSVTALRRSGVGGRLLARLPATVRLSLSAGAAAAAVVVGAAALVVAVLLMLSGERRAALTDALQPGTTGGPLLLLLSLAYLPVLVAWTAAFLVGPGVALGAGAVVSPFEVAPGDLPAFPLLAVVPESRHWAYVAVLLVPVLAGAVAALVLARGRDRDAPPDTAVLVGSVTGVAATAGLAVAVLAWLSSGGLGSARLSGLGPDPLATGAATAGLVGFGCLVATLLLSVRTGADAATPPAASTSAPAVAAGSTPAS
ncbi:MAG: DUF6350 family protein [Candidatus Nanopelagicales bacterium]